MEAGFLRHGREGVRAFLLGCSVVFLAICVIVLLSNKVWLWDEHPDSDKDYPNSFRDNQIVFIAIGCLQLVTMALLLLTRGCDKINVLVFELYGVLLSIVVMLLLVFSFPPYLGRATGHPFAVEVVAGGGTEPPPPPPLPPRGRRLSEDGSGVSQASILNMHADMVIGLTIVGMIVSLNQHIRWHLMLPVQVSCVLAYLLPALIFSDMNPFRVMAFGAELATLMTIASVAKRTIQKEKRLNYLHLIQEKTRRFSSEFQLSLLRESSNKTASPEDDKSTLESLPVSVPTTTETGMAFNIVCQDLGAGQMDGIIEVGKKEQWLLDLREVSWNSDQVLGMGGFGIVVQGQYQGISVAMKVPKVAPSINGSTSAFVELCNELQILRRLRHPNIVGFYGALLDAKSLDLALLLELVDGVTLRSFVSSPGADVDKARILCHISCALVYLHSRHPRVVHGDLKDTNIYVEANSQGGTSRAKLLDFGLSRRITRHARPLGGTLLWMAPEVAQGASGPITSSDVFSFGRVLHFVVTGAVVGEGRARNAVVRDLKRGVVQRLDWPTDAFARAYREAVEGCNQADPASRPEMPKVHKSMQAAWEWCSGTTDGARSPLGAGLQKELLAVRRAAHEWKAKTQAAAAPNPQPRHPPHALEEGGQTPQNVLPGSPEEVVRATAGEAARLYPDLDITPRDTQMELVLPALVRVNATVRSSSCCQFHAAMENLQATLDCLKRRKCSKLMPALGQCAQCGVILTKEDLTGDVAAVEAQGEFECDFCGEMIQILG